MQELSKIRNKIRTTSQKLIAYRTVLDKTDDFAERVRLANKINELEDLKQNLLNDYTKLDQELNANGFTNHLLVIKPIN